MSEVFDIFLLEAVLNGLLLGGLLALLSLGLKLGQLIRLVRRSTVFGSCHWSTPSKLTADH